MIDSPFLVKILEIVLVLFLISCIIIALLIRRYNMKKLPQNSEKDIDGEKIIFYSEGRSTKGGCGVPIGATGFMPRIKIYLTKTKFIFKSINIPSYYGENYKIYLNLKDIKKIIIPFLSSKWFLDHFIINATERNILKRDYIISCLNSKRLIESIIKINPNIKLVRETIWNLSVISFMSLIFLLLLLLVIQLRFQAFIQEYKIYFLVIILSLILLFLISLILPYILKKKPL